MSFEREWFLDKGKSVSTSDGKYPSITIVPMFTENGNLAWFCTIICQRYTGYEQVETIKENINLKDLQGWLIWAFAPCPPPRCRG